MIGVAYKGAAFPVIWEVLSWEKGQNKGKAGGSSTAERKELFERFLRLVPAEKIQAFVADREFISAEGLGFLAARDVPFVIRIRSSRKVALGQAQKAEEAAPTFFQDLALGEDARKLQGQRFVSASSGKSR